jgi:diguanylate cyclase (GGDEF)-like protein
MLTDLPNRRMLNNQLSHNIANDNNNDLAFSLLLIDLNGFKDVNDTLW